MRPGPGSSTRSPRAAGSCRPRRRELRPKALASPRPVAARSPRIVVAPGRPSPSFRAVRILRPCPSWRRRRRRSSSGRLRPLRRPPRAPRRARASRSRSRRSRRLAPPRRAAADGSRAASAAPPAARASRGPLRRSRSHRAIGRARAASHLQHESRFALRVSHCPQSAVHGVGCWPFLAVARLVVVREEIVPRAPAGAPRGRSRIGSASRGGAPIALVGVDVPAVRAVARDHELAAQTRAAIALAFDAPGG